MRLALGAPRRALVVAPHPDDEIIGAWGLMRRLRLAGARVDVLVASDGAASHPGSRAWPPARLAAQRRRETLWALRGLGVSAARVRFLGLPDGGLGGCMGALRSSLARELRRGGGPDLVVGPDAGDDHADHRAVAAALALAAPSRTRRLAYPVWPAGAPASRQAFRLPLGAPAMAKRAALRLHRSQAGLVADDPDGFRLSPAQVAAFTRPSETFIPPGRRG